MTDSLLCLDPCIDAAHLAHQREWSTATFGPGRRLGGVLDHIRRELAEVEANPDDLSEWADVIILAFDGALRSGADPQAIIDAIKAKQARNEARSWPDWRGRSEDEAIEHDRSADPPEWSCPACRSDRWVAAADSPGGRRFRQCVPCGRWDTSGEAP